MEILNAQTKELLKERFGHDSLMSVATIGYDGMPWVRIVNAYYEDGAFYSVTNAMSNKMQQIAKDPRTSICGEWFTARGRGENIGHPRDEKNTALMARLREEFAAWYQNGHTNEDDPNTCILKITLTDATLWHHGTCYEIDFK